MHRRWPYATSAIGSTVDPRGQGFSAKVTGADPLDLSANGTGAESTAYFWLKFLMRISFKISFLKGPNYIKKNGSSTRLNTCTATRVLCSAMCGISLGFPGARGRGSGQKVTPRCWVRGAVGRRWSICAIWWGVTVRQRTVSRWAEDSTRGWPRNSGGLGWSKSYVPLVLYHLPYLSQINQINIECDSFYYYQFNFF